ncbi:TnsA endonuclease N-terminal domain-containing protein [Stenotrophomonas terrae]|uniref:TnsA endonuclease N-terminal domain-containing protein n=1 Tax=Stenotrophomonas terrae TaxID=405446 RepID=UPI0009FA1ED5|nr:TnsA endonuclease N-terminal domain-containing protein [Stenotrophomonas terrae]
MAKRRYDFDEARISRFLKEGRGTGQGQDYKPWLTIHDVPSLGLASRIFGFKTRREHHCLSNLEAGFLRILEWSELVLDIREQFPLDREVTRMLAGKMGIEHPRDPRTRVDVVMTTDFMVDVRTDGRSKTVAYAIKPAQDLEDLKTGRRTIDKLELERRYWSRDQISWHLVTDRDLPKLRIMNLAWLHEMRSFEHELAPHPCYWQDRCDQFLGEFQRVRSGSIDDFFMHLEGRRQFAPGEPLKVLRHLAANKQIVIDLDREFSHRDRFDVLRLPEREQPRLQLVGT